MKALLAFATMCAVAASSSAQQVPTRILVRPQAELPGEWTSIVGVRELSDGRVVVLDARDQAVKLVDFKAGSASMVGRKGNGPGEYVLPLQLFALAGDSSVLYDEMNSGKPLIITPRGAPGPVMPNAAPAGEVVFLNSGGTVDGIGHVYRLASTPAADGLFAIERFNRASKRVDTVAYASRKIGECAPANRAAASSAKPAPERQPFARAGAPRPFPAVEEWTVSKDGTIAMACPDPYRVIFVRRDGSRVVGPTIPYQHVRVGDAEKQSWRDDRAAPVAVIRFSGSGQQTAGYEKPRAIPEPDEWPDELPAFGSSNVARRQIQFAPDGSLWIARMVAAGAQPLYDVIDANGRLAYRVVTPRRTKLVGFGRSVAYFVRLDDDDIQHLQRYALPR